MKRKGFTIIEVVLVLAIAGLIFLMVFIALPALQRSQRNTQREDDLARIVTAVNDYRTNNKGKLPFHMNGATRFFDEQFVPRYVDENCTLATGSRAYFLKYENCGAQFTDPDGTIYGIGYHQDMTSSSYVNGMIVLQPTFEEAEHKIRAYNQAYCDDEGLVQRASGMQKFALVMILEGGAVRCNDNE